MGLNIYSSVSKKGPLWIVQPSSPSLPQFILMSETYLKERHLAQVLSLIAIGEFQLSDKLEDVGESKGEKVVITPLHPKAYVYASRAQSV